MNKLTSPETYTASRIKRANFEHSGDVAIDGDVAVPGTLFVLGDLTITGSLNVGSLICYGDVTVGGKCTFTTICMRGVLACRNGLNGDRLIVAASVTDMPRWYMDVSMERKLLVHAELKSQSHPDDGALAEMDTVNVQGGLEVESASIHGNVEASGGCRFDRAHIEGFLDAYGGLNGDDLMVKHQLFVLGAVDCSGRLDAYAINVTGSCSAGEIHSCEDIIVGRELEARTGILAGSDIDVRRAILCKGDIEAGGHIRTANRIQTRTKVVARKGIQSAASIFAPKGVQCGSEFGIFAGLCVKRQYLSEHGYIATRVKPQHIKRGVHVKGKRFKELNTHQRERWPAFDGSDGMTHFR